MKNSHIVDLPCCAVKVAVTHRKAKLAERPRNHACPQCGKKYLIGANLKPVNAS